MGYKVKTGKAALLSSKGYSAGPPRARADDLNGMFEDSAVDAVWCLRGGHSGIQLLEFLDYDMIRNNPKIFIGFSDITVFHTVLNGMCSLVTFHGPMPRLRRDRENAFSMFWLSAALSMKYPYTYPSIPKRPLRPITGGFAAGRLTGGTLSLYCALLGTGYFQDPADKILFIEDVDEPVSSLERMLWQLKYAGVFDKVSGVVTGAFEGCRNEFSPAYGPDELIMDFFRDFEKPVVSKILAGHCLSKFTMPMGAMCLLDGDRGEISFVPKSTDIFM